MSPQPNRHEPTANPFYAFLATSQPSDVMPDIVVRHVTCDQKVNGSPIPTNGSAILIFEGKANAVTHAMILPSVPIKVSKTGEVDRSILDLFKLPVKNVKTGKIEMKSLATVIKLKELSSGPVSPAAHTDEQHTRGLYTHSSPTKTLPPGSPTSHRACHGHDSPENSIHTLYTHPLFC